MILISERLTPIRPLRTGSKKRPIAQHAPRRRKMITPLPPAIEAIRSEVQAQFWSIPPAVQKPVLKKTRIAHKKTSATPAGISAFERKVKNATTKVSKAASSAISKDVKAVPSKKKTQKTTKKQEKEMAEKDANTPAEQIVSEEIKKPVEKILGKFQKHPIIFAKKLLLVFAVLTVLFFIFSPLLESRFAEIAFWLILEIVFLAAATAADIFLRWKLNVSLFTEERIISVEHDGVLSHRIELIPLGSVKYIDLKQEGFTKTLLDYGDIHVTSFITESSRDMTLGNLEHVKKAFTILQKKVYASHK